MKGSPLKYNICSHPSEKVQDLSLASLVIRSRWVRSLDAEGLKDLALTKVSWVYGFANHSLVVKDFITLPVIFGDDKHTTTEMIKFLVVDHPVAYKTIFGIKPIEYRCNVRGRAS
ncbi:hypothetical protein J1N35_037163 [Gossypium stocksii]|uniref:Uncharacterized protein n=1 Tax=Gossypium stocksii TaxID=47602 RepID=A0A9D3ULH4_9ROSI|nr:hypothetical protein J1N35_037163 [Gossypium stocksii]